MTEDATENIPSDEAFTQVAWSVPPPFPVYDYPDTPPPTPAHQPHEHAGLKMAGAAVAVMTGAVALAALLPYTGWREPPWRTPVPATVTATATSILPAPVTQTTTETMTTAAPRAYQPPQTSQADEHYVDLLITRAGFVRSCLTESPGLPCSADPAGMILLGHAQCDYLALGNTEAAAAAHLRHMYPRWTAPQALAITDAAATVYCPSTPYQ